MVKGSFAATGAAATLDGKLFTVVDGGGESGGCTVEVVVRLSSGERQGFTTTKGDDNEDEEL